MNQQGCNHGLAVSTNSSDVLDHDIATMDSTPRSSPYDSPRSVKMALPVNAPRLRCYSANAVPSPTTRQGPPMSPEPRLPPSSAQASPSPKRSSWTKTTASTTRAQPGYHRRSQSLSPTTESTTSSSSSSSVTPSSASSLKAMFAHLSLRRQRYGETHIKVASLWNRIGNHYFVNCQYEHALDAYKHSAMCDHSSTSIDLASIYANIGTSYMALGRANKSVSFMRKALDIYELQLISEGLNPDRSTIIADTLYQLGLCLTIQRNLDEALKCLARCQKIRATLLGSKHIQMGRTMDAIGKVHFMKQEYTEALHFHEEALRIKQSAIEEDENSCRSAIITSLLNIAAVHSATQRWNAATSIFSKVMQLQKTELVRCRNEKGQSLARAARELGDTMTLLSQLYYRQDQEKEANKLEKEALLVYQEGGMSQDDPRLSDIEK